MKKMKSLWLLVLILLILPFFLSSANAGELFRVKQVYDGDTVLLEDGRKVRYLGINSPEFLEPFFLKAKRLNESLVLRKKIRLEFDQERMDAYNRLLAYVYIGDQMVNARMVGEGLAHAFFIGPNRKYQSLLLQTQAEAKQRKAGMWSVGGRPKDLKVTNVHLGDPEKPDPSSPYVRIVNLSQGPTRLSGYTLSNEGGKKYLFPEVSLDPGYTVIVVSTEGKDGVDERGQLIAHWPAQKTVWDAQEDTAFLTDPSGGVIEQFHYKGKKPRLPSPPR
jgi:endonuclease YncB( thermonuclease family)